MTIRWGSDSGADISLPWSGNCALSGTRIVNAGQPNDDVALAWAEFQPGPEVIALWRMNEAGWSGAAGEVEDAADDHDATAVGASTAPGWLDRAGLFAEEDYWYTQPSAAFDLSDVFLAAWLRPDAWASTAGAHALGLALVIWNVQEPVLGLMAYQTAAAYEALLEVGGNSYSLTGGSVALGSWAHVACWKNGTTVRLYVNGQEVAAADDWPASISWPSAPTACSGGRLRDGFVLGRYVGAVDDALIAATNPWGGEFSPHRYEPGAVAARYALGGPHRLTAIDWQATTGADYGEVTKVEVYSGGTWLVVAEDDAGLTPPILGLSYQVDGPDIVRLTLTPKADSLQSETPVVDWLQATLEAVGQMRETVTVGYKRKALTVLYERQSVQIDATRRSVTLT